MYYSEVDGRQKVTGFQRILYVVYKCKKLDLKRSDICSEEKLNINPVLWQMLETGNLTREKHGSSIE